MTDSPSSTDNIDDTDDTGEAPPQPLPHWQRLVAATIAAYWAPLKTQDDGMPVPDTDLVDECDYGQADHILAALLAAGATLPGVRPGEITWLPERPRHAPADLISGHAGGKDPLLSLTVLAPHSVLDRMRALTLVLDHSSWQKLMRTLIEDGLTAMEQSPCPRCETCCVARECADNSCVDRGCDCCPDEDNLAEPSAEEGL